MRRSALLLVLLLTACSQHGIVMEQDGQGALFSTKGKSSWSYWQGGRHVGVGQVWSFGNVMLCRSAPDDRTSLRSLEPASVEGQVRIEPISIRMALRPPRQGVQDPNIYFVGAMRGAPRTLHKPAGWVVPNTCHGDRVSEIVVTMAKTGPKGGGISGIRVTYSWNNRLHEFTIPVGFGICGTATREQCSQGVTGPPSAPATSPA